MTIRAYLALACMILPIIGASVPALADDDGAFVVRILNRHNEERSRVGVKPLAWDARLAAAAAVWGKHLAATRQFEHSPDDRDATPQGENLWMGTRRAYSYEDMVDGWIEERKFFRAGLFPRVTTTQNWSDVGHYTQLIWHNTTHVGCAIASNPENDFLVCRYSPAGNWDGEAPTGSQLLAVRR